MKPARHNSKFQWVNDPKAFQKALSLALVYSLIAPSFVKAQDDDAPNGDTKSAIIQHGSMQGALSVLGKLNKAMETAAQNPNDDWRREEVRKAVQAVPAAVQSVAGTFAANTMGNSALPFVLSTLGSAIDVDAPNSFDKHLKNPNPAAIQRSSETTSSSKASVQELTYAVKEEARTLEAFEPQTENKISLPSSEIAKVTFTPVTQERATPSPQFSEIVRQKEAESVYENLSSKVPPPSDVITSLKEDLAVAEAVMAQAEEVRKRELSSSEEADFLSEIAVEKAPQKDSKQKKQDSKKAPAVLKPTSWLLLPLFYLAQLETEAHAEPGGGQPGVGNPLNGTPTNPGDQSGGGAGQILFGIAAIIGAVAPMVVAGQQAQSEQNIANTQAQAQIQQAEIQTSTQKEMAQMSAQTALAQAQAQQDVAKMNNDAQTERLQINLAASQQQRNEQRQAEAEQLALTKQLEAQKVALAMQKADQDILMARQSLEAKKLQMALSGSTQMDTQAASGAGAGAGSGSPIAAALAAQAVNEGSAQANTPSTASNRAGGLRTASAPAARALMPATSRLLASVDSGIFSEAENIPSIRSAIGRSLRGLRGIRRRGGRVIPKRGWNSANGLYRGIAPVASGSFPGGRIDRSSELVQFSLDVEQSQARRVLRQNSGAAGHSR